MENELLELKEEIKNLPVNRLGHRTYSDELRDRVVGAALAWRSEGKSLTQLAFATGVQRSLVSSWVRKREMRGARCWCQRRRPLLRRDHTANRQPRARMPHHASATNTSPVTAK